MTTRRDFLSAAAASTLLAATTRARGLLSPQPPDPAPTPAAPTPRALSLLILGGTRMLGPAVIEAALARNHRVTIFNRGRTEHDLGVTIPDAVERLIGDRDPRVAPGLTALNGRTWDAVVDTSGLFPRHVTASAILLRDAGVPHYIYISSISAYDNSRTPRADESDPPVDLENPYWEEADEGFIYTGELKRPCEIAVERIFANRAAILRPTYMVGPGDVSGRFAYWPIRVREAVGDHTRMLVPGHPALPIQIVDVRDIAAWIIHIAESRLTGLYNACGSARPHTFGDVLRACERAANKPSPPGYEWVPWEFVRENRIAMPIILPDDGEYAGFHTRRSDRALTAGFTLRALIDTARDTLDWWDRQPPERQPAYRGSLTLQQEAQVLARWDSR